MSDPTANDDALVQQDGATDPFADDRPADPVVMDFFGEAAPDRVDLPGDQESYVLIKSKLVEGDRRKILNEQNKSVRVQKGTGDAIMRLASGDERRILLETSIVGWNLQSYDKGGVLKPVAFTPQNVGKFLTAAPVEATEEIERQIRKRNPWLLAELSKEDIQKEIDRLQEMLELKDEDEAGNDS